MKNSKVGMRWVWLWLAVMVLGGGGLGCGNEECKKDDVICAKELKSSAERNGEGVWTTVWTAPSDQKEDAVWDKLYASEIRIESTGFDHVYPGVVSGAEKITQPLLVRLATFLGDARHTLTIYDNEAKRGSHISTELCLDSTVKQVDCAGWVAARKKKILPSIKSGWGSVRCYGFSIANTLGDPLLDKITWGLGSTTSYQVDIEPGMTLYLPNSSTPPKMEPLRIVASKASKLIGSSPKTITAFDVYSLSLPLGKYSLAGAGASHYVRAGWTLGDTTVGCTLLQSRFVEIRAKASPMPLAKNEVLTVLFTQGGFAADPVGKNGWCYYTSKLGEHKTAKPYRGSTAGAKCEMIN